MFSYKSLFGGILTLLIVLAIYIFGNFYNPLFLITNFFIILFSIYGMFSDSLKTFSLKKIFFVFNFFIFGVIPFLERSNDITYWGADFLRPYDYILANIIIIIGMSSYLTGYMLFSKSSYQKKILKLSKLNEKITKYSSINLVTVFIFIILLLDIILILYFYEMDFSKIFFRGMAGEHNPQMASLIKFLTQMYILKPMPILLCLLINYFYRNKTRQYRIRLILINFIFIISILLFSSPISMPRFLAVTLYASLALTFFKIARKELVIPLGAILGILVIMPILEKFRRFDESSFSWEYDFSFFFAGHFDAYNNFTVILHNNIISYGHQLLGSTFFWIPRAYWTSKPIGSGAFVADTCGLTFSNISMPFIAEGYINFSIIGVILFLFSLGYFCARQDFIYWELKKYYSFHFFDPFYYLSLGMILFVLRGDLMSSFAYSVAILGSYTCLFYFISIFTNLRLYRNQNLMRDLQCK